MGRLQGRAIIVTGGTGGIGRAAAQLFAREGASVAAAARPDEEGRGVVNQIVGEGGRAISCTRMQRWRTTIADWQARLSRSLDDSTEHSTMPELSSFGQTIVELPKEEWDRVMTVNLKASFSA